MDRRTFLRTGIGGSIVGISGCLGGKVDETDDRGSDGSNSGISGGEEQDNDADNDGVPDSEDDYPNNSNWSAKEEQSGHLSVEEDEWYRWEFEPSYMMGIEYDILVRDGPAVDVVLFPADEFTHFENGDRARYYEEGSDLDTQSARNETVLESGEDYVLVIDNTNYGEAAPPSDLSNNIAEIEYSLTAKM